MNRSLNVFLGLSICLILFGGMWFLSRVDQDNDGWRPGDMYSQVSTGQAGTSSFTNATLAASSANDGVLVSMRSRSFSSRVHTPVFSYAPASGGAMGGVSLSGGRSSVAAGQGLYATSGAELRSFGGGGNASAGSAGGFRSNGQGAIAQASGLSSPLSVNSVSYTPVLHTSSSASGDEMLAVAQASNVASVSSYAGMGYTTATYGTSTYGTASYGATASRISGRKNSTNGNSILTWLAQYGQEYGTPTGDEENGYTYSYDYYQLKNAYDAYCRYMQDHWDEMWGTSLPSFDEWLLWFQGNGGSHRYQNDTYNWVPVGDYYPLLILAMLYVGYMVIRRRKQQVLEN